MLVRTTARTAGSLALTAVAALLAAALLILVAAQDASAERPEKRPGKDTTPIELSSEPARLEVRPCLPETLRLGITNESSEARFVDVHVTAEAPVESSKKTISTYVPAESTVFVNVRVSAPRGAAAGEYEMLFEEGRREKLTVPVALVAPPEAQCLPREDMTATATSAQEPTYAPEKAIDGDEASIWHTRYSPERDPLPQSITLDLGSAYDVAELSYQPRPGGGNGTITAYNVYASPDGQTFTKVASGTWTADASRKTATFSAPGARYVRLEATEGIGGFASAAEIVLFGQPAGSS